VESGLSLRSRGALVTLKVYENEENGGDAAVVRVTVAPMQNVELNEDGHKPATRADADDNSITLDPNAVEDLEEELIEIGFSSEAATWIVGKVPV
jgi:hypothetical protein